MPKFFYSCDNCENNFSQTLSRKDPRISNVPSEKEVEKYGEVLCPKCKKKVKLKDFLDKPPKGVVRTQVESGPFKGAYLERS